jgi:ELWxxDGT repeat protein
VVYFIADDGVNGSELWRTTGGSHTTFMVKDIFPGSSNGIHPGGSTTLFVGLNKLFFRAYEPVYGAELWMSDGTQNGTDLLKDIHSGVPLSTNMDYSFELPNGKIVFSASNTTNGRELWITDGTYAGTHLLKDIRPGHLDSEPVSFTWWNNALYFTANDGVHGRELWKTDGTANGTQLAKDIYPGATGSGPATLTVYGNYLVMGAKTALYGDEPVFMTTNHNWFVPKDINLNDDSDPYSFHVHQSILYFSAVQGGFGREIWRTDGTNAGTYMLKDIAPFGFSSYPKFFTSVGNELYFVADDETHGDELWRTNGTGWGTEMVQDIYTGSASSGPEELTVIGDKIYFRARNANNGSELWRHNTSLDHTSIVKDILPGYGGSHPQYLTVFNNTLYFVANDGQHGRELWESYGTGNSTAMLKDIRPGYRGSRVRDLEVMGNALYFSASDGVHGIELWVTDGSESGTVLRLDQIPGSGSAEISSIHNFSNKLYFSAFNPTFGKEVFVLDPSTSAFPVEGLVFDAQAEGNAVKLDWITEKEFNTFEFEVQRSADGLAFQEVSRQMAAGESDSPIHYQDWDMQPLQGRAYYRLKQIDLDGTYTYSKTVEVFFKPGESEAIIYPNPSNGQHLNISIPGGIEERLELTVYDLTGKRLWTHSVQGGSNWQVNFGQHLSSGQYVLVGVGKTASFRKRFVVK